MNPNTDFYQLLQVNLNAKKEDIISAYRRLSKLYHPDISGLPQAQERMAQINIAYDTLSNDTKRQAYNNTLNKENESVELAAAEAKEIINKYFTALLKCDYQKAFHLLDIGDRLRVGVRAFTEWRKAVHNLYEILEFKIHQGQYIAGLVLENTHYNTAIKFIIDVWEKDHSCGRIESYSLTKYVVFEDGNPGVYLGYLDLDEIAKTLGSQARELEQNLMRENWQEHLRNYDSISGLLTREGLLLESRRELYRAVRYRQPLIVALFSLETNDHSSTRLFTPCLQAAAQALKKSLRLTDIPAYLGNGLFAVLFFELKKRHATLIIERTLKKTEQAAGAIFKEGISASYAYEPYNGGNLDNYLNRLAAKL
ncbi:MAG: DnaJ domain-containing protein [Firmicutes bacterium]|nr:DnaJ domain-containing protein [Bacillota bacterium]